MLNIGDSVSFLFKEKNWLLKFGIIFFLSFLVNACGVIMDMVGNNSATYQPDPNQALLLLGLFGASLLLTLIYSVIGIWYTYEVVQSGIQKRATKLIWEYSFADVIKKISKYFLASIVYGIIIFVFIVIIVVIPLLAGLVLLAFLNSLTGPDGLRVATAALPAIALVLTCVAILAMLVIGSLIYMFTMPAYLRLIATNTFAEAFNFKSNFRIGRKYFWYFLAAILVIMVTAFAMGLGIGVLEVLASLVAGSNQLLQGITQLLIQIPFTMVVTYLAFFVYTRMIGNLYRNIITKESELKFLREVK